MAQDESTRMIHVRLPEELHKRLRIRVAELDTTIQDWVAGVLGKEIKGSKDAEKHSEYETG